MLVPKKYLHDKLILLLVSLNVFLMLLCISLILLRLGAGQGVGYIVQYRANLGFSAFKTGSVAGILDFIGFALVLCVMNIVLSVRTYQLRRELSIVVLGLGALVLLLATIVSNALLVLR